MDPQPPLPEAFDRSRRHRRGVSRASTDFEAALARPAGLEGDWSVEVRARLTDLAGAFRRHVDESEGPTGLLQEIVDVAPRLAHSVELLKKDHQTILADLSQLSDAMDGGDGDRLVGDVRDRGLLLVQRIGAHRHHGADLVYDAYSIDVEGGG